MEEKEIDKVTISHVLVERLMKKYEASKTRIAELEKENLELREKLCRAAILYAETKE